MAAKIVIAADLGASGGKMAKGCFDGNVIQAEDFYEFPNQPMALNGNLYWDLFRLYNSILSGMSYYAKDNYVMSIGIDTWGASYGLLDKRGRLLEPIYHYRDMRTENSMENMHRMISKERLFDLTGCQPNRTYTLLQLYSYIEHDDKILDLADKLLFLPDLLEYFLSGDMSAERSIAGTSGLLKPEQDNWSLEVLRELHIQDKMLPHIIDAGSVRGTVLNEIGSGTGIGKAKVIATTGHDTAGAVTGIPGFGVNQVYVSIGTNINMGIELTHSVTSQEAFQGGFKNAGVIDDRKILYRDFSAFWLLNELSRTWSEEGKHFDFSAIMDLVLSCESRHVFINVEEASFNNAGGNMKQKINKYLIQTGQETLDTDGEFARCIFESIALKVKYCTEFIKKELHIPLQRISVINGGSRNHVLMQMFSDALGMQIYCGLPYATLIGNILTQFYALGEVTSVDEMRELSKHSFEMREYLPGLYTKSGWDADLQKMMNIGVCK